MDRHLHTWEDLPEDNPIALLKRRKIEGDNMLVARVELQKGCVVAVHSHESEQMAIVVAGKVRWTLGHEGAASHRIVDVQAGQVVQLPGNFPHGVEALEDSLIYDILSPVGAMGIDSQKD